MGLVFGTVSTTEEAALLPNVPEFDLPPMNRNSGTTKALLGQGAWLGGILTSLRRIFYLVDTTDAHDEGKLGISGNIVVSLLASLTPQPVRFKFRNAG